MKRTFTVKTELKKKPGIYKISCTETDKVYIGESVDISQRMQKHFSLLRKNKHSNPILQNIFNLKRIIIFKMYGANFGTKNR